MGGGASAPAPAPVNSSQEHGPGLLEQVVMRRRHAKAPDKSGLLLPADLLGRVIDRIEGNRVRLSEVCRTWEGIMCGVGGVTKRVSVRQPKRGDAGATTKLTPHCLLGLLIRFEGLEEVVFKDGGGAGRWGFEESVWPHLPGVIGKQMELKRLAFVSCGINDEMFAASVKAAAGTMKQTKCALQGLEVDSCDLITAASIVPLGRDLDRVTHLALRRLRLNNTQVKEAVAAYKILDSLELQGMETCSAKVCWVT